MGPKWEISPVAMVFGYITSVNSFFLTKLSNVIEKSCFANIHLLYDYYEKKKKDLEIKDT